ncbi:HEAT repeat domain-containing protein [Sutcliffiella horikoshii]|uniref:HEAT repeat domain-containing protein n=1 Tax=Sutcliffiella horikoshii TaxID=79883 RepID=A0A5D4SZ59_9BACI|nr:HEAT repeat domain-containing protein [Sutcliffiella horikoshii]TYS67512.1 HEAT repeat domain-containing protein [Sutcliffiella horikoshii]
MISSVVSIVLVIILSFFILLSILFIYMLVTKLMQNSLRQKIDQHKEELRAKVFEYLYRQNQDILEQEWSGNQWKAMEELFSDFADVVQGDEVQERITHFANTHFMEKYKRNLLHRRWSIRMNSLYAIEDFQLKSMVPYLLNTYEKRTLSQEERRQLLKILVRFQTNHWEELVIEPNWRLSEFMYRSLLGVMTERQFQAMVTNFDAFPEYIQLPVLDMIGIEGKREFLPFLEDLLRISSGEKKIRILKALNELGYSKVLEWMGHVDLKESSWEERLMLSKLLGRTNRKESLLILTEFLSDTNYDVRNNAAKSILSIEGGAYHLHQVLETSSDRFARDMAEEWLQKGGQIRGR